MFKQAIRLASNRSYKSKPLGQLKSSIDKHFPSPPKVQKEWEKRGISKDEFFVKKYSFMSDDKKKQLQQKTDRQNRFKQHKRDNRPIREQRVREEASEDSSPSLFDNALVENVYGRHAVLSALKSKKRQLFEKLMYMKGKTPITEILKLCEKYGIKTELVTSRQKLDQFTNKGVHNGVALTTRKLDLPTLAELGETNVETGEYKLKIWNDVFNSQIDVTKRVQNQSTNPLGIYLDEVTDPQNVGAIIRSAYYLGVDFIVTPSHNTARLGPVAAKAAAGALDLMDIYQVENSLKFIREVSKSDWSIVTTDIALNDKVVDQGMLPSILDKTPVLLVLGSEGSGVRTNIKNLSDFFIKLSKNRRDQDNIVDSLNVSAAASVIISSFFK